MKSASIKTASNMLLQLSQDDIELCPKEFSHQVKEHLKLSDPILRQEKAYLTAFSYLTTLASELALLKAGKQLEQLVDSELDLYSPAYPPISPVTDPQFTATVYMAIRIPPDNLTAADIVLQILRLWDVDATAFEVVRRLCSSRLGIFETRQVIDQRVLVRELVTDREFLLYSSSGYRGTPGELRLSRVAPPLEPNGDTFFEFTTPYLLVGHTAEEWTSYLLSNLPSTTSMKDPLYGPDIDSSSLPHSPYADQLAALFQNDSGMMRWNDFIMDAYSGYTSTSIQLTGIPCRPETLPHKDAYGSVKNDFPDASNFPELLESEGDRREHRVLNRDLFDEDGEFDDSDVRAYFEELESEFRESPEAALITDTTGSYIYLLLKYCCDYFRKMPPDLDANELNEILYELIPRKVVMEPDAADSLVRQFQAFLLFLYREYGEKSAKELAKLCDREAAADLRELLGDTSGFGMAKSLFSAGTAAGFDMTTEEGLEEFTLAYNSQLDTSVKHAAPLPQANTTGRNEPCPCGSGKKYKKCCLKK